MNTLAEQYLHLMKLAVTDSIYSDLSPDAHGGNVWPDRALSMIGIPRLNNVIEAIRTVIEENIPGDIIETGVWRGGSTMLMRAALTAYGDTERTIWVADSFAGLPPPDPAKYPADLGDRHHTFTQLAISLENVQASFKRLGLLDDRVKFLKGWFKDTLPNAPIERLAILRLDGDMYESTMDGLRALYSKISPGGYIIIDDYFCLSNCKKAVNDFREQNGITIPIIDIEPDMEKKNGAYWRVA